MFVTRKRGKREEIKNSHIDRQIPAKEELSLTRFDVASVSPSAVVARLALLPCRHGGKKKNKHQLGRGTYV